MAAFERPTILILENDFSTQKHYRAILSKYSIGFAEDAHHLLGMIKRQSTAVVLLDLGPAGSTEATVAGFTAIEQVMTASPVSKVIVMTEANDRGRAAKAIGLGAHDFFEKPVIENDLQILEGMVELLEARGVKAVPTVSAEEASSWATRMNSRLIGSKPIILAATASMATWSDDASM